jgi:hypothetical protein
VYFVVAKGRSQRNIRAALKKNVRAGVDEDKKIIISHPPHLDVSLKEFAGDVILYTTTLQSSLALSP